MPENIDDLLPTAKGNQEAGSPSRRPRRPTNLRAPPGRAAEAEKRKLIDKLSKPSGLSEEEKGQACFHRHSTAPCGMV